MRLCIHYELKTPSPRSCSSILPGLTVESSLNSRRDPATVQSRPSVLLRGPWSPAHDCVWNSPPVSFPLPKTPRNLASWTQVTRLTFTQMEESPSRLSPVPDTPLPEQAGGGGGAGAKESSCHPAMLTCRRVGACSQAFAPQNSGSADHHREDADHPWYPCARGRRFQRERAAGRCPGGGRDCAHVPLWPPDTPLRAGDSDGQVGQLCSLSRQAPPGGSFSLPCPILVTHWGC